MSTRLPAALLAALVMLVLVPSAAGAQTRTGQQVGAGALLARTTDKPWRLVFLERTGRTALSELPGAGLGFLSASGWARVTRVLRGRRSGRAYVATLVTDDPLGRRVALRVAPDGEGVIALRAKVTRAFYGRLLREPIADGHDGWMEDFGEYTPLDARAADGSTGSALHNDYPRSYHCAAQAAAPRAVRFVRSGWTGSARCSPVVWGGDPTVAWGFDGLRSVVTNGLTMGLSGVSTWGSDIGGFFALLGNRLTPELLVRWIEVGAVSGVMRTQGNGIRIPDTPRPQVWDEQIVSPWRRWAKLRTQLYPYLRAAEGQYRRTGLPIMRHLALPFPRDPRAAGQEDTSCSAPTYWPRRYSSRAKSDASSIYPAVIGSTCGARRATSSEAAAWPWAERGCCAAGGA